MDNQTFNSGLWNITHISYDNFASLKKNEGSFPLLFPISLSLGTFAMEVK